jgi:hypothetical protein
MPSTNGSINSFDPLWRPKCFWSILALGRNRPRVRVALWILPGMHVRLKLSYSLCGSTIGLDKNLRLRKSKVCSIKVHPQMTGRRSWNKISVCAVRLPPNFALLYQWFYCSHGSVRKRRIPRRMRMFVGESDNHCSPDQGLVRYRWNRCMYTDGVGSCCGFDLRLWKHITVAVQRKRWTSGCRVAERIEVP